MNVTDALAEIRKGKQRKFEQSIEVIINLRSIDIKREGFNTVVDLPHKIKDKKVCGFLPEKSALVKTIAQPEFKKFAEKKELKKLVKEFDYFIALAPLMPKVASTFGKVLGPVGKMPSPQLGILQQQSDEAIKATLEKIAKSLKVRLKEASIKLVAGREKMKDEEITENIKAIYSAILAALPRKQENIKSVLIKTSMGAPVRVEVK